MSAFRSPWLVVGLSLLLALAAAVVCAAAVGLGLWTSAATLAEAQPPLTPTLITGPPTAVPLTAQSPQAGARPRSSVSQIPPLPEDVPLPESADPQSFVGGEGQFSYLTSLPYEDALSFYRTQLPELGWEKIDYGTRLGEANAELHYRKEGRTLTVRIVDLPFIGRLIEVSVQA